MMQNHFQAAQQPDYDEDAEMSDVSDLPHASYVLSEEKLREAFSSLKRWDTFIYPAFGLAKVLEEANDLLIEWIDACEISDIDVPVNIKNLHLKVEEILRYNEMFNMSNADSIYCGRPQDKSVYIQITAEVLVATQHMTDYFQSNTGCLCVNEDPAYPCICETFTT